MIPKEKDVRQSRRSTTLLLERSWEALPALALIALACRDATRPPSTAEASASTDVTVLADTWVRTDLGSLGGTYGIARGINDSGIVVGVSETGFGRKSPFRWRNGVMTKIPLSFLYSYASAHGVNASGSIVGEAVLLNGERRAFVYLPNGTSTVLPKFTPGDTEARAYDINRDGVIVGHSGPRAVRWVFLFGIWFVADLGNLGASPAVARAINDSGWTVGYSATGAGRRHAWRAPFAGPMQDIGTLAPTDDSFASDINVGGEIAGTSRMNGVFSFTHFLWQPATGTMTDIGVAADAPTWCWKAGISDKGRVVGTTPICDGHFDLAKPFTKRGATMTYLPLPGANRGGYANAVNTCGLVAGAVIDPATLVFTPVVWRRYTNGLRTCDF